MLYIAVIAAITYACLNKLDKLEKEEELKKAKEDGYDVFFSR